MIEELQKMLAEANQRSFAVQVACNDYLEEEKELKERLKVLEAEVIQERKLRHQAIAELNKEIELWMEKYEVDMSDLRRDYIK